MPKTEPPRRYKEPSELTVEEHRRADSARRRSELVPKFERPEYRAYVRGVHEAAGLEPPDIDPADKPAADLTPDEHFRRIRRR